MPGPLRMLLTTLGVMDDIEFVQMSDLYQVLRPDGFKIALKTNKAEVISTLQDRFPHEKEGITIPFPIRTLHTQPHQPVALRQATETK